MDSQGAINAMVPVRFHLGAAALAVNVQFILAIILHTLLSHMLVMKSQEGNTHGFTVPEHTLISILITKLVKLRLTSTDCAQKKQRERNVGESEQMSQTLCEMKKQRKSNGTKEVESKHGDWYVNEVTFTGNLTISVCRQRRTKITIRT